MNKIQQALENKQDASYQKAHLFGLSDNLLRIISDDKQEPEWMRNIRKRSLATFLEKPMPTWGPDISDLDFDKICYYAKASDITNATSWDDVPDEVKETFEQLGIPQAEREMLAGVGAQYESETIYHSLKKEWDDLGVIFLDMDEALKKHEDLVKKYFMKAVPYTDHKFAALHTAVWSGGTFLYVPKGVKIKEPLQSYFRMNAPQMGQFEHTLIIIDEGAEAHYIEGCSAPKYDKRSLHAGCVEVFVHEGAKFQYSSIENWSKDTYNLNTKRAMVDKDAHVRWIGGNMGSSVTMLYPCSILRGKNASADHLGIAVAADGQYQDTGAKVIHLASNTSSRIISKSLSKGTGVASYRGLVKVAKNAENCVIQSECDALLLEEESVSLTNPTFDIQNHSTTLGHEASSGKINEEDVFYLMTRGLSEKQAEASIVHAFLAPVSKNLPLEYAAEMNILIDLEIQEGKSVL
ncbi:Fe-S cluster assembly protein SufB [Candidatus Peregrinibacteria bacterium]|nr:MAG: Fe-S cluster assembly protein SufB [Candidatus Peregrinibacteria bacterium]